MKCINLILTFSSQNCTLLNVYLTVLWPEQVLLIMLHVSKNQAWIDYTHFSKLLPSQCDNNCEQAEWDKSDGNNQEKKEKSWLGCDGPVFSQAFSARLLFLDLAFLWHRLLLLSVASSADGLCTVLWLQLRGYQMERSGCRDGEKGGTERERQRDRETEGIIIQSSRY